MEKKPNYQYQIIKPSKPVVGTNLFNGRVDFEFIPSSDQMMNLSGALCILRAELTRATAWDMSSADNLIAKNCGVNNNPYAQTISTSSLFINDVEVSKCHDFGIESTVVKLLLNNNDENIIPSGSPVVPVEYSPGLVGILNTDVINNGVVIVKTGGAVNVNTKNYSTLQILKNVLPTFDIVKLATPTNTIMELVLSHPLEPLFMQLSPDDLYQSKIRISVQINPDLLKQITRADTEATSFKVLDFTLNIPTYNSEIGPPSNISFETTYTEIHTTLKSVSSTSLSTQITLPSSSIKFVTIVFPPRSLSSTVDKLMFDRAFSITGQYITSLYINFANRTYPHNHYTFPEDYMRAYQDYYNLSNAKQLGVAPALTFKQWLQTPVFVFICLPNPGNQSNLLDVKVIGTGIVEATDMNMAVCAFYDKKLSIDYGPAGEVIKTTVQYLNE